MISRNFSASDRGVLAVLAFLVIAGGIFSVYRNRDEPASPSAMLSVVELPPSFFAPVEKPAAKAGSTTPLDLNRADLKDLENLPAVGPSLARRIVEYRRKVGRFKRVEELLKVSGIGPKKFLQIRSLVQILPPEKQNGER